MAIDYERMGRKQMLIGAVSMDLQALHDIAPEAHDMIVNQNKNDLFAHHFEEK